MRLGGTTRGAALRIVLTVFAVLPWVESARLALDSERRVATCAFDPAASISYLASLDPGCPLRPYERVDGVAIGGSSRALHDRADLLDSAPTGPVRATFASGADRREATVVLLEPPSPLGATRVWLGLAVACAATLVGLRILLRRSDESSFALAALCGTLSAVAGCVVAGSGTPLLDAAWIALPGILAASATHLALVFPREHRIASRLRGLIVVPYALAGLLVLLEWLMLRQRSELWDLPDRILCTWFIAAGALLAVSTASTLVEANSLRERRMAGVLVYTSVALVGLALVASLGVGSSLPLAPRRTVTITLALVLGAFAYALARHGNLDAPRWVRWWTSYALYAALVASVAWALAQIGEQRWDWPALDLDPPILLSLVFAALLALDGLRRFAWSLSEGWVDPWAPRLERVRAEFLKGLSEGPEPDRVMALLVAAVAGALDVRQATGYRRLDSGSWRLSSARGTPFDTELTGNAETLMRRLASEGSSPSTILIRELLGQQQGPVAELRRAGVSLACALPAHDAWQGMLLIGSPRRESDLSSDHLTLAEQLAAHAALAIEKAVLEQNLVVHARICGVGYAAAGLAHDLGRPLGEIFLEARHSTLPEVHGIRRLASECIALLERFLEEAKAGRRESHHATPLALIVEAASERIALRHPGRRPALRLAPHLPRVADALDVQRVVEELLDNATQWSVPGQQVELVATTEAGRVEIRVIDHGKGMNQQERRRAFEPFYSARSSTGLGLTICQDIVRRIRGSLELTPSPGGGTTAVLKLPEAR